jgi:membrane-bound lytic murein transglycosylase D
MPTTGSDYGLRTNSAVEDRSNPVKSTDAAARYLKDLHTQFGDWALALAAYNSGPTRVNSAIRRSGSRDFWRLQRFLPTETRNYVPAFIAATYICNYYAMHGLRPYDPDMDEQLTDYIKVYEGISFRDIAEATGIPYASIKNLNPGFRRDYVPPTTDGHYVIVPQRVMPAFIRYLNTVSSVRKYTWSNADASNAGGDLGDGRYYETQVNVNQAEHIDRFASRLGLCGDHLRTWNKLTNNFVYPNQTLKIMHPVLVQKHSGGIKIDNNKAKMQPAASTKPTKEQGNTPTGNTPGKSSNAIQPTTSEPNIQSLRRQQPAAGAQYQYHTVRRNESLEDIARQYATSVESLRKLNKIDNLKFGMRLKIREY